MAEGQISNIFRGKNGILKVDIIHGEFHLSENQFSVDSYLTLIGVKAP